MMIRNPRLIACLIGLVCLSNVAADPPRSDPVEWTPEDAFVFLAVSDIGELWKGVQQTAAYQMLNDAAAAEASSEFNFAIKLMQEARARVARALETEPEKLQNPFGGGAVVYVTAATGEQDPQPVLVVGVADRTLMRSYFDKAVTRLKGMADQHEAITAGSNEIQHFRTKPAEEESEDDSDPFGDDMDASGMDESAVAEMVNRTLDRIFSAESMPPNFSMCLTDDRLVLSDTPDRVRAALRQFSAERSLRDTENYRRYAQQFKPLGVVRMLLNVSRTIELIEEDSGDEFRKSMAALGLDRSSTIGGHLDFSDPNIDYRFDMLWSLSGERRGIPKILSMKNREIAVPRTLSRDTLMVMSANLNFAEMLEEIESMIRASDPAAADNMRKSLAEVPTPDGPLNLRKELFENLREPITFGLSFVRPFGPDSARILLSVGHRDKPALDRLLTILMDSSGGMVTQRDLSGSQVFDLAMAGFSLAATSDLVMVGNTSAVDAGISASASDGLSDDPQFRRAVRLIGGEASALVYVDSSKLYAAAAALAKQRDALERARFANPSAMIGLSVLDSLVGQVKPEKAEQIQRLERYAAPGIMILRTEPEGIRATQVQMKPAKD